MLERLQLSTNSQTLINSLQEVKQSSDDSTDVFLYLLSYLNNEHPLYCIEKSKEESELLKAELIVSLLNDLLAALATAEEPEDSQKPTYCKLGQVVLLGFAGTLVAACQGFDSVLGVLSMLPVPNWAILVVGIAFSILSVAIFYSLDLIQVSAILGVRLKDTPKLLDTYLLQLQAVKKIRKTIQSHYFLTELTKNELAQLEAIVSMLQGRINALLDDGKQFDEALHSWPVKMAQFIFSAFSCALFFGGGFFAGQSVALYFLGLIMASATPVSLPVILFSVFVGIAALCLYLYLELSESKNLITGWFGLNKDTIEQLCNIPNLTKQQVKLGKLKNDVIKTASFFQPQVITSTNEAYLDYALHG